MASVIQQLNGKHPLLSYGGFLYSFHKYGSEKMLWRCSKYNDKCPGRLHTSDHIPTDGSQVVVIAEIGNHTHCPNPIAVEQKTAVKKLKMIASNSTESTASVVATVLSGISAAAQGSIAKVDSLKRSVQIVRHELLQGQIVTPLSRAELELPARFTTLSNGENFLAFDSGKDDQRILMFTSAGNIEALQASNNWYCDGTFKASPKIFYQLFIIHGDVAGPILPLVYFLMPNRTGASYDRALAALSALNGNLRPATIMSDFEQASITSFRAQFPNTVQRGCFFHFSQCIWRKIQDTPELLQKYTEDSEFCLGMKQFPALAFVPLADADKVYEDLLDSPFVTANEELLVSFLRYFERTWVGDLDRRGHRRNPSFALGNWNCYDSVMNELAKTNNAVEGFHRGFSSILGGANPTVFKLVASLMQQQAITQTKLEQALAGVVQDAQRTRYAETAAHLKNVVMRFGTISNLTYLRGVAHSLDLST